MESAYSNFFMQRRQPANRIRNIRRATRRERFAAGVITLSVVGLFAGLWGLQKIGFDFSRVFNPCGFKQTYGLPCPACGMTTSVLAFARGDVVASFRSQPASAFVCSLLVVFAFLASLVAIFGLYFVAFDRVICEMKVGYWLLAMLVILLAGWAVTMAQALAARASG